MSMMGFIGFLHGKSEEDQKEMWRRLKDGEDISEFCYYTHERYPIKINFIPPPQVTEDYSI